MNKDENKPLSPPQQIYLRCIANDYPETIRFHLRRSACRLLSSQPSSFLAKPSSIRTKSTLASRLPRPSISIAFQRRWATSEAEVKQQEETDVQTDLPISEIQPTAQEEVENAISSDNAAGEHLSQSTTPDVHAPEVIGESKPIEAVESDRQSAVDSTISAVTEAASNAVETVKETAESVVGQATGATQQTQRGYNSGRGGFDSGREGTTVPKPTVYIGNLFFDVTENDLVKELARFGTIKKCRLMRDSRGLSKGFGYVDFETTEAATAAINTLHQQLFEGRRLAVQYAAFETKNLEQRRNSERPNKPLNPPSKTLFIGNMSFEMTDRDLNNLFRGIRNVIDVRVAIDRRTGQPRGFAHADFVDTKSAMEALKVLQEKETYGRKLRLDYSYGPSNAPRNQPPQ